MARAEWRDERIWEGLMRDIEGTVVSGTMSNLFLRRGSALMTPAARSLRHRRRNAPLGARAGAGSATSRVWQGRLPVEALRDAEEVFMTNAVRGVVSVGSIETGKQSIRFRALETAERLRARLELG